jgi:hypothetical protein
MALETDPFASGAPMAALPTPGWASLYRPFADGAGAGGRSPWAFGRLGGLALPAPRLARCGGHAPHSANLSSHPA